MAQFEHLQVFQSMSRSPNARLHAMAELGNGMAVVRELPGNALLLGEMGIGNSTAAAALCLLAALLCVAFMASIALARHPLGGWRL